MRPRFLLHHLLRDSAERAPDAEAVRLGDQVLSYGELEARSSRLARALQAEGCRAGDRVGLHLKKSPDAVVGLLGIMRAGACAVPVATGTPAARFADIAGQCGMRHLVTSPDALVQLAVNDHAPQPLECALVAGDAQAVASAAAAAAGVRVASLAEAEAAQHDAPPDPGTIERDLAYVLFTSGSTGRPKGVMLSHRAVLTFVDWATAEFAVRAEDRLSNHAPFNFDLSTFDIFAALHAGASVTLVPEGLSMFPTRLADLIERDRISVWYSVPSVLTLLAGRGMLGGRDLSALRVVLFAGEVFPVKHLRKLMLEVPHPRYANLYGPTETNVCTFHEVREPPAEDGPAIPIGRACANTRTVVLDEAGNPVTEPGREGLLFVGGPLLMDGYWGRPEETAAAFSDNPLTEGRREPLYCTGDWVTIDEAGDYRFVGRRDHMVKVGGYRIELGEIESALYAHPAVREAAAVDLPDELLGSRIRAFVVAGGDVDEQGLRRHCAAVLPKYMVPQEIVLRDALPRTSTDKVDRPRLRHETAPGMPGG